MMSTNDGTISKNTGTTWLKELGFPDSTTPMDSQINTWWDWYCSKGTFYKHSEVSDNGKTTFTVERISFSPAKMTTEDWTSILVTDDTAIGLQGVYDVKEGDNPEPALSETNDWLQDWVETEELLTNAVAIERGFGTGTGGWALELEELAITGQPDDRTKIRLRDYDARHILPLTFDGNRCTECGFVRGVTIEGKAYTQWTVYKLDENKTYDIHTAHFKGNGQKVELEKYTTLVKTGVKGSLFALYRPGIDNTYWDHSPFGASIFDNALGCVKLADGAFDNAWKDIYLGQKMVFMPEELIQTDKDGNAVIPREKDQQLMLKTPQTNRVGETKTLSPEEYNPDLRVDQNRIGIDTALSLLGKRVGFGFKYYSLDDAGGINKTAKEVASDNAELMRNAKKHQRVLGRAMQTICMGAVALADKFTTAKLADVESRIAVLFGDTIIQDEDTERERMRADVAAGLVPAWKYVEKYYALDEDTAKAWVAGIDGTEEVSSELSSLNGAQTQSLMAIIAQYAAKEISEGQAINLISTAIGVDKAEAKRILDGDLSDLLVAEVPEEV